MKVNVDKTDILIVGIKEGEGLRLEEDRGEIRNVESVHYFRDIFRRSAVS